MNALELQQILINGEDSKHQFKREISNLNSLAAELVAFSNSGGGHIFIGIDDNATICGLTSDLVRTFNQQLSNTASNNVRPPVHLKTANVATDQGVVIVATVPDGLNKPYMDLQGRVWVKSGSDKRHVTSREEMQRMFLNAGLIQADTIPVAGSSIVDRIEIISPGHLPGDLSTRDIQQGKTKRRNPVLSEHAANLLPYRGLGSGIHRALEAWPKIELQDHRNGNEFRAVVARPGAPARATDPASPEVTPEVTPEVVRLVHILEGEMSRQELMRALELKDEKHFRQRYQQVAVEHGWIEMTIPDKPRSRLQRYRLTQRGQELLQQMKGAV